ncbi:hypothetical protein F5Y12DRAFT_788968 [Xylaria sp. FL1777]|nr:hypothetical protein F5Y12DRAFT_788968 [Xylaria sp. FL1777]
MFPRTHAEQQRHDEEAARMNSMISDIRAIYDANTPLFTKDAIRKAGEQLEICKKDACLNGGRNVILRGINGVDYEYFAALPPERSTSDREQYFGGSMWMIAYHSIEHLTIVNDPLFFDPETAYLPMMVAAFTRELRPHSPTEHDLYASSTEELREAFYDIERKWKMSEYYDQLQAALAIISTPPVLDKVFGVALGPLILNDRVNPRSVIQHALISTIYSTLLQRGVLSASSKRYAQDPIYTQLEKDVLCSAGFTVLEDPQAFLMLDDSSILVSINPDIPVKQIVADICRPGIIIWPSGCDLTFMTDPDSPRVDRMIEKDYYKLDFPFHQSFGDLVMYIRKVT